MVKQFSDAAECSICGLPGIAGLRCSDPDCHGIVESLPEPKPKAETDRYSDDLLKEPDVLSLDQLADQELEENEDP